MQPVGLEDILGRERYGAERIAIRQRLIDHKRRRRVAVGERVTLVFEDRATVWYQTQEMLWVEQITDLDAIRHELGVYNQMLPGPSELSATLLIEIEDQSRIREDLHRLCGIDEHLSLETGAHRVPAVFEPGRQTEEKLSAVQYVRFPLDAATRETLVGGAPLVFVIDHPNYRARNQVPEPVRASLVADLTDAGAVAAALKRVRHGN